MDAMVNVFNERGRLFTELRAMFNEVDRDSDGWITRDEMVRLLRRQPKVCEVLNLPDPLSQFDGEWSDVVERIVGKGKRGDRFTFEDLKFFMGEVQHQPSPLLHSYRI